MKQRLRNSPVPDIQGASSWLSTLALGLVTAKLIVVTVLFDPLAAQAFALPKSAASHAITFALLPTLVLLVVRGHSRIDWNWASRAAAAYLAVAVLSTLLSPHPATALHGALGRYLGLTSILDGAVFALAVASAVRSVHAVRVIGLAVASSTCIALVYYGLQQAGLDPFRWREFSRASTFGNTTVLGGYLTVVGAALIAALFSWWDRLSPSHRFVVAVLLGACALTILAVGARGAVIGLAIGGLTSVAVAWRVARGWILRRRFIIPAFLVIALAVVVVPRTSAWDRMVALASGGDLSTAERALIYRAAFDAFLLRPVLGSGPDSFVVVYPSVRPGRISVISGSAQSQDSEHSWLLHQAVGTGVLGVISLGAVIAFSLVAAWRRLRSPGAEAAVLGLVGLVAFLGQAIVSVQHVATETLFWTCLGLIAVRNVDRDANSSLRAPTGTRPRRRRPPTRPDALPAFLALLIGVVLGATVIPSIAASHEVLASRRARAAGDFATAALHAERAVAADGGRADYWNELGLAKSRREPESALRAFDRASDLSPYDPVYLLNLAKEELLVGTRDARYVERAIEHATQAAERDPRGPETLARSGEILWSAGRSAQAVEQLQRALELHPDESDYLSLAADVFAAAGRRDQAIAALERMGRVVWPSGDYSRGFRLRLGELYFDVGDRERLAALVPPPRATLGAACEPSCVIVVFAESADIVTDDSERSALNLSNYSLEGRPLPVGTRIRLEEPFRVVIMLPRGSRPRTGDAIEVRSVADAFGQVMSSPQRVVLR